MQKKFTELKEDILKFFESIKNEDPKEWTQEKFSKINAMITCIEEEFMNMEKDCNNVISDINELRKIFSDIRKTYFEIHEKE